MPEISRSTAAAPSPAPHSLAGGSAPTVMGARRPRPAPQDPWERAEAAMAHLEYAVNAQLGGDVVNAALDDGARALAEHVDGADETAMPVRQRYWRSRMRKTVGLDGRDLDKAALMAIRGDIAGAQIRQTAYADSGVSVTRDKDAGYVLQDRKGARLIGLPRFAGTRVLEHPKAFGAQLRLLQMGLQGASADALFPRALAVFSDLHERDHNAVDMRILYKPTEARAEAFVSAVTAFRNARTAESKAEAETILRTVLFAEAAPANRLASFGLDLTPLGRINAAKDFGEDGVEAMRAFNEGRLLDAGAASLWTLLDGMAVVGGIRFGKILEKGAQTTPIGRRIVAARHLARMEGNAAKKLAPVNAETMLGQRLWNRYDEDSQVYMEGLLRSAKGAVGEEAMRKFLVDVKANGKRGVGMKEGKGRKETIVEILPEHGGGTGKDDLKPRFYDEILEDTKMQRVFGLFLWPASTPGKKTRIEVKADAAPSPYLQAKKDDIIKKNLKSYHTHEMLLLRVPYDEISKTKIRQQALAWMRSPEGAGMQYIKGVDKFKKVNGKKVFVRRIQWSEAHFEKMIDDVDKSLRKSARIAALPTFGDFLVGLSARVSIAAEAEMEDQIRP